MRHLIRAALIAGLLTGPMAGSSSAVTVEDLVNLQANGLSDDILVALIASDGSTFRLSAADVLSLFKRGLGEKVILAMVSSGQSKREPSVEPDAEQPPEGRVRRQNTVEVPVPTVVHVQQTVTQRVEMAPAPIFVPVPVAVPVIAPIRVKPPEPEYWGFGGKLRPDAWRPAPEKPNDPPSSQPR